MIILALLRILVKKSYLLEPYYVFSFDARSCILSSFKKNLYRTTKLTILTIF